MDSSEFASALLKKNKLSGLPEYSEPEDKPTSEFPLHLVNFKQMERTHSRTFNNDYLMEMKPDNPVIMNSGTAKKLGLKDGDRVWIESPFAKAKGTVQVSERIHPEVVALHHGYGHWGFGKVHGERSTRETSGPLQALLTGSSCRAKLRNSRAWPCTRKSVCGS